MASELGATYSLGVDYRCTHIVTVNVGSLVETALAMWPWLSVVHPRWLTRCWNTGTRAPEPEYEPTFYHAARRCGTRTCLGWRDTFWDEVGLFHMAEAHFPGSPSLGKLMGDELRRGPSSGLCPRTMPGLCPRTMPGWCYARDLLVDTVFWGRQVRGLNWRARGTVMMVLYGPQRDRMPRPRRRITRSGGVTVLLALARMDANLVRCVIEFL